MEQILILSFSGIVAISTVFYACLTSKLVKETKAIRILQFTPDVQVYLEKAETNPHLVYLIIENFGSGKALDVKFDITRDFKYYESERLKVANMGSFKYGLSSFYPKKRYKYFFTNLSNNFENKISDRMEVSVTFKDIFSNDYKQIFVLKIDEILGTGMMSKQPDSFIGMIAFELSEINKKLGEKKTEMN